MNLETFSNELENEILHLHYVLMRMQAVLKHYTIILQLLAKNA